jgi:hypothetical protein
MSFKERRFNRGGRPRLSYVPLALLLLYLVAVRLTIARNPDMFRSAAQAAVFTWPMLGVVAGRRAGWHVGGAPHAALPGDVGPTHCARVAFVGADRVRGSCLVSSRFSSIARRTGPRSPLSR